MGRVHHRLGAPYEMEIEEPVPRRRQANGPGHEPFLQLIVPGRNGSQPGHDGGPVVSLARAPHRPFVPFEYLPQYNAF